MKMTRASEPDGEGRCAYIGGCNGVAKLGGALKAGSGCCGTYACGRPKPREAPAPAPAEWGEKGRGRQPPAFTHCHQPADPGPCPCLTTDTRGLGVLASCSLNPPPPTQPTNPPRHAREALAQVNVHVGKGGRGHPRYMCGTHAHRVGGVHAALGNSQDDARRGGRRPRACQLCDCRVQQYMLHGMAWHGNGMAWHSASLLSSSHAGTQRQGVR